MKIRWRFSAVAVLLALGPGARALQAQALSESTGVGQYFTNCARCHESDDSRDAPRTSVLKQMTPERIYESLTTGTMRTSAANLSDQDKRLIAEWLGGRKIDTDSAGAAEKMPNQCGSHPPVRRLNAPGWNGWGVDHRNSRAQAVIDGRVYVTSNAGYVYSLDAETGCVHWSFRSQAVVRSGFTVGRMSRTSERLVVFFGDIHGTAYALDASTGEVIWKTQTDSHPLARITGTPVLNDGRLYVPVASLEEPESGLADYACCTFRGYLAALDATTGEPIWKTFTIPEEPKIVGKNSRGKDMLAPAGGAAPAAPPAARGLNPPNGSRCGQPQMQALANPEGNQLVYTKVLEGVECFQTSFTGFAATVEDHQIRLENKKVGAGVRITGDRRMSRLGYWSIRTVMAVEPYIDVNVEPGKEFTWKWTYDYFVTK